MVLNVGIISGLSMLGINKFCTGVVEYTAKVLNTTYEEREILFDNILEFNLNGSGFSEMREIDYFFIPMLPAHSNYLDLMKSFFFSTTFFSSETYIMSAAPRKLINTALGNLIEIDSKVVLLFLTIMLCASLYHTITTYTKRPRRPNTWKVIKLNVQEFCSMMWRLSRSLLQPYEPLNISDDNVRKFFYISWIMTVMILIKLVGCFFNSTMSLPYYAQIDTIEDIKLYPGGNVKLMKEGPEFLHLISKNEENSVEKRLLEEVARKNNFLGFLDYLELGGIYEEVQRGQTVLLVTTLTLSCTVETALDPEYNESELKETPWEIYISKYIVNRDNYSFLIKKNTSLGHKEVINLSLMRIFDSKTFEYLFMRSYYLVNRRRWRQPSKEITKITYRDFFSGMYLLIFGYMSSLVILVICLVTNILSLWKNRDKIHTFLV